MKKYDTKATPKNYRSTFRFLLISSEPKLWSDNSLAVPKLPYGPHHPEVTARVLEMIQSMTPEEARAFLEYRKPGIPEYWFGEPIDQNGHIRSQKEDPEPLVATSTLPK